MHGETGYEIYPILGIPGIDYLPIDQLKDLVQSFIRR